MFQNKNLGYFITFFTDLITLIILIKWFISIVNFLMKTWELDHLHKTTDNLCFIQ